MAGCLDGIRVLELARFQAGPRAGMVLADLGADVIKIEPPGGEPTRKSAPRVDDSSIYFSTYNRGKKSICLDMRKDEGKAAFLDLVKHADFVLENFRPGTMEKMGLGFDKLCEARPDIILVRVTAYGQYGTHSHKPGFDPLGQAISGLMMLSGQKEGKPIGTAFSIVDRLTALHATIGALAALHYRGRTGRGQIIDTSLADASWTMVEIPSAYYLRTGKDGGEGGRPPFKTKDGYVVVVGATKPQQARLLELMGKQPGDNDDPLSAIMFDRPINTMLREWCPNYTTAEVCRMLDGIDVPCAPVNDIPRAVKHEHMWERNAMVKVRGADGVETYAGGMPVKFSETPGAVGAVPAMGEHSDMVMREVAGYSAMKIAQLRERRVLS